MPFAKQDPVGADRLIYEVEEALEIAFLSMENRSLAKRIVGLVAAIAAAVAGVVGTIWVFTHHGVGLGLLSAYVLPIFVLAVMMMCERVVPSR